MDNDPLLVEPVIDNRAPRHGSPRVPKRWHGYGPMFFYCVALFAHMPAAAEFLIARTCEDIAAGGGDVTDCGSTAVSSAAADWSSLFSAVSASLAIVTTCALGVYSDEYGRRPVLREQRMPPPPVAIETNCRLPLRSQYTHQE
jgi:hypothetical protein